MWLARDKSGILYLYLEKPIKQNGYWYNTESGMMSIRDGYEQEILQGRTVSWSDEEPTPLYPETGLAEGVKKVIEELDMQIKHYSDLCEIHLKSYKMSEIAIMSNHNFASLRLQKEAYEYAKKVIQTFCKIE